MLQAKLCRRCGEEKSTTEFRNDSRYKDGFSSWCAHCHRQRNSEWARENRARLTHKARGWREQNRDLLSEVNIRCKTKHKERYAKQHAEWAKENRGKRNAASAKRKAAKLRATPAWADHNAIAAIYAECARISEATGIPHHVDHIVPLQHPRVCGLHCEANLRIIPASENLRKKNRFVAEAWKQPRLFEEPKRKPKPAPNLFDGAAQ
jgi:hypothetical protein